MVASISERDPDGVILQINGLPDIPMAELTRQYLGYVEMMRRTQLELAAEYLLMAAVLIEIMFTVYRDGVRDVTLLSKGPRARLVSRIAVEST